MLGRTTKGRLQAKRSKSGCSRTTGRRKEDLSNGCKETRGVLNSTRRCERSMKSCGDSVSKLQWILQNGNAEFCNGVVTVNGQVIRLVELLTTGRLRAASFQARTKLPTPVAISFSDQC